MRTTWQHSLWVVLTTTAISLLTAGLSGPIWGQSLEEQLVTSLQRYQELGAQGNYAEAIPSVKKFIELSEKQFGLGDEFTVIATNNLAEYYVLLGRYAEAEQIYQHIFAKTICGTKNCEKQICASNTRKDVVLLIKEHL